MILRKISTFALSLSFAFLPLSSILPTGSSYNNILQSLNINPTTPTDQAKQSLVASYAKLPLTFEENVGQTDAEVLFLNKAGGTTTYFTKDEAVFVRSYEEPAEGNTDTSSPKDILKDLPLSPKNKDTANLKQDVIRMQLIGANSNPKVVGLDKQQSTSNYFIGNNKKDWQQGVSNYSAVKYENIYNGIDLIYYGNNERLEFDFIVAPNANPDLINFKFQGTTSQQIDSEGNLLLKTNNGEMLIKAPFSYQDHEPRVVDTSKIQKDSIVDSSYKILNNATIAFTLGNYDQSKKLVIDPYVLGYSTYLGGE